MAAVELIYPRSSVKRTQFKRFRMKVKDGPGEYMTEKEHQDELRYLISLPSREFVFYVGAMHSRMILETGQMIKEDIQLIQSLDDFFKQLGYHPSHCFGRQDFGRQRVTSDQATRVDALSTQKSSIFVALPTLECSENAKKEVRYRLWLEKPVIALTYEHVNYRDWFIPLVESYPSSKRPSVLITGNNMQDLIGGLTPLVTPPTEDHVLIAQ